ncbi:unnamed protein product [Thelazia callipaeda]|uniref:Apple domain-containing protein n=1 Tax=Thelazia callipaeda TaxID=103827 RepID=A0A0N5CU49_THECL|nr:unnamed protein product [Thelazia callipaeda]
MNANCACITYLIEHGRVAEGKVVDKFITTNFQDCLQHCSKHKDCTAVNFLIDVQDESICLLIDQKINGIESELPVPEIIIYSATSFCITQNLISHCNNNKIWSFERFPRKNLIDDQFVVNAERNISLQQCLHNCLKREQCRASLYNKEFAHCRYLNVSIQNVHNIRKFFKHSKNVDLYENNYFTENYLNLAQCHFIRMQSSGFTNVFDERIAHVEDKDQCESLCLSWSSGNCRSFTYHQKTQLCYLSHSSSRTLNKNLAENYDPNLFTGDLEDCIQFKLMCKPDRMHLYGMSVKMFSGILSTKNNKKVYCEKKFLNVYKFDAEILYDECGMKKSLSPHLTFSNLIMLKEGSTELITVRDKILKVVCHIHKDLEFIPENQYLSFQFQIDDENTTKQMLFIYLIFKLFNNLKLVCFKFALTKNMRIASELKNYAMKPKYTLEVMDDNRKSIEQVRTGDKGFILITLHEKPVTFSIIDMIARDVKTGTTLTMIDSNGCIVRDELLTGIHWIDKNHLQLAIVFDGFSDDAEIIYEAYVKQCGEFCHLKSCEGLNVNSNQQAIHTNKLWKRHSLVTLSQSRVFQLSDDIYAVKSSHKLKLERKFQESIFENNDLSKEAIVLVPQAVIHNNGNRQKLSAIENQLTCDAEELKCLIIFVLFCFQIFLLAVIVFIAFAILQRCLQQRTHFSDGIQLMQNTENSKDTLEQSSS